MTAAEELSYFYLKTPTETASETLCLGRKQDDDKCPVCVCVCACACVFYVITYLGLI